MSPSQNIVSQYLASLEMLKQTIQRCPDSLWDNPEDQVKFWNIAYHALFYTHFYLQDSASSFEAWSNHRKDHHLVGRSPEEPLEPYRQTDLLEYLAFCQNQVRERVPKLDLAAESGFHWLPFNKLELQIYNIRHLQQHTGELMERVGTRAEIEIDWVGMAPG